jgi:hypothetical protein
LHFTGWLALKAGHLITRLCARTLQSTKEDKTMNDREKTSYRLINHPGKTHPITCAALARLAAHQHRMALRQRYFCWALVESPKQR